MRSKGLGAGTQRGEGQVLGEGADAEGVGDRTELQSEAAWSKSVGATEVQPRGKTSGLEVEAGEAVGKAKVA